ncbi:Right handed beta helix region [Asanoa hainanensis]|uniref:Right handed beta helix region n=1 Tax=Asanoa hainanensis TaxID=560556 RepID=A0A239MNH1_9ACTN|nr:right-handed parallel beta-helix repeat-containing protein [Asanoa hainanensis]SNT43803.1 Right handed beta helix region [Asanoa hainanensis]
MRVARSATLLAVGVLMAAGLPAGSAAATAPPDTIFVSKGCQDGADGTEQKPFCSISAAATEAEPGQTIVVGPGVYQESVSPPSGEPGRPITIKGYFGPGQRTTVATANGNPSFVLSDAHDIVLDRIDISGANNPALVIDNSADVTVTGGWIRSVNVNAVDLRGDSRRVTISGNAASVTRTSFMTIGAGVTDTMLVGNSLIATLWTQRPAALVTIADAPRTTATNNTIVTDCNVGIAVTGASSGFRLYNTIVRTRPAGNEYCSGPAVPDPATVPAVTVDSAATPDSLIDYNVIDPVPGAPAYSWRGTAYPTPAAFHSATGQGAHDIGADARLYLSGFTTGAGWDLEWDSPAIDSAWTDAPGLPATDLRLNGRADKPDMPNSGGGFVDRGAIELVHPPAMGFVTGRAYSDNPLETVTTVESSNPWTPDGQPLGYLAFSVEGRPTIVDRTGPARLTFDRPGRACVQVRRTVTGFREFSSPGALDTCTFLGASFNAVTPQRVLNTKAGVGVPRTTALAPHEEIELPLPAPAATSSAVVLNVTVTNPTSNGYLKVYPTAEPVTSNINFVANQTVPNLVTVPVANGRVKIKNGSAGTVHVLADLAGYYAAAGFGLTSFGPVRVLDTRSRVGVPGTTPVGANGRVTVDLSSRVPVGTTAVVLNVAVTKPTTGGHLTAFPPGGAVPATSNLNFVAGQTANNMVIAPVVDRKIAFAYGGSGTVHVLADLSGYFAPGITDTYLPVEPKRILDTRQPGSTAVGPGQTIDVQVDRGACPTFGCRTSALVANLTVTGAQSAGYLTVYPNDGAPRPAASVINFNKGETIANLITVNAEIGGFLLYNSSAGTVHVVVDQAGYYLLAPTA